MINLRVDSYWMRPTATWCDYYIVSFGRVFQLIDSCSGIIEWQKLPFGVEEIKVDKKFYGNICLIGSEFGDDIVGVFDNGCSFVKCTDVEINSLRSWPILMFHEYDPSSVWSQSDLNPIPIKEFGSLES